MITSNRGLEFVAEWEGERLQIYNDVAGYPTIGIGHLIIDGEDFSGGITHDQAMRLLADDIRHTENSVNRYVDVSLVQHQFDALVSFTFNVGGGAFRRSTLLRRLNAGKPDDVPAQLRRWNRAGGKVVNGLINRRDAECKLWRDRDYGPSIGIG
jgi:lysozyme